ncbi:MAG: hypothetical protein V9E96_00615 [Chitinophagaceae bacterium]
MTGISMRQDMLTVSGLFGIEKIIDRGDQPFFNKDFTEQSNDCGNL